jgi:2'-5' RNA ligase
MRLFVAIDLDLEARKAIDREQRRVAERLGQSARGVRFVNATHLHLTLVFLGEVDANRAAAFANVFGADVPMAPFDVTFGGLGVFPVHGDPRVLWLGVIEGAVETIAIHKLVQARAEGLGMPPEGRTFHPHLTIGRWRESRASDRRRVLDSPVAAVARVRVEEVDLIESRLSPSGPSYTRLISGRLTS